MTVVSIVFAILLMTLTLASTQFSPRILVNFVRDRSDAMDAGRVPRHVLLLHRGVARRALAAVPVRTGCSRVLGAMLLALLCVGWLIFFINHISQSISVNHIVDRIARETELVIDELMPRTAHVTVSGRSAGGACARRTRPPIAERAFRLCPLHRRRASAVSRAKSWRIRVRVERGVGHFVPAGVPLLLVSRPDRHRRRCASPNCCGAFDIGPTRTLQQDVEFGIIQIVDIALRAISPAVNDPSTAISCIDQLSRIMIRWLGRAPPASHLFDPPHVLRVVRALDQRSTACSIRRSSRSATTRMTDVAVSLRLLRAYADIAGTLRDPALRDVLHRRAQAVVAGCEARLPDTDLARLHGRAALLAEFPR